MSPRKTVWMASLLASLFVLGGCTIASSVRLAPQSHFVHPNSNVKALGPVKATAKSTLGLVPQGMRTSEMDAMLYNKALAQQQDADMIIDYVMTSRLLLIPLLYLNFYMTTYELQGTGAKAEVGKQVLH